MDIHWPRHVTEEVLSANPIRCSHPPVGLCHGCQIPICTGHTDQCPICRVAYLCSKCAIPPVHGIYRCQKLWNDVLPVYHDEGVTTVLGNYMDASRLPLSQHSVAPRPSSSSMYIPRTPMGPEFVRQEVSPTATMGSSAKPSRAIPLPDRVTVPIRNDYLAIPSTPVGATTFPQRREGKLARANGLPDRFDEPTRRTVARTSSLGRVGPTSAPTTRCGNSTTLTITCTHPCGLCSQPAPCAVTRLHEIHLCYVCLQTENTVDRACHNTCQFCEEESSHCTYWDTHTFHACNDCHQRIYERKHCKAHCDYCTNHTVSCVYIGPHSHHECADCHLPRIGASGDLHLHARQYANACHQGTLALTYELLAQHGRNMVLVAKTNQRTTGGRHNYIEVPEWRNGQTSHDFALSIIEMSDYLKVNHNMEDYHNVVAPPSYHPQVGGTSSSEQRGCKCKYRSALTTAVTTNLTFSDPIFCPVHPP